MRRIIALTLAIVLGTFAAFPAIAREGTRPQDPLTAYGNEVLIIGRAGRQAELNTLGASASHCGVSPIVETLEQIRGWWPGHNDLDAIRLEVEWTFGGTNILQKNVLLFGGWTRQAEFQQFCEIPTWFVYVGDLAEPDGLTASDQLFGDITGDGHWDIPVFRLVTRNASETNAYCQKVGAYYDQPHNQVWQTKVAIHCDDRNLYGGALPARARELSLQLPDYVGGSFVSDAVILSAQHDNGWNEDVFPTALSDGKAVIVAGPSVGSDPGNWLCFNPWGFRFNQAPANSRWPLMLGYSCEITRFQEYWEAPDDWAPLCRDFVHVTDYRKGPIAMVGPTCGSHQYINFWLAELQLPALMEHGMDFGHSLVHATNALRYLRPETLESLRSYAGVGVPWLKLHRTTGNPAGVAEGSGFTPQLRLLVSPNPARIGQGITLSLSNPAQSLDGARVFGPDGRLVRNFTALQPGPMTWDLRDNNGNAIPSGIYFLKVPGIPGAEAKRSIVVVR